MGRYLGYSEFLKEKYGEKVYKAPVALTVTCPNRDGLLAEGGCIFCGPIGADYETRTAVRRRFGVISNQSVSKNSR